MKLNIHIPLTAAALSLLLAACGGGDGGSTDNAVSSGTNVAKSSEGTTGAAGTNSADAGATLANGSASGDTGNAVQPAPAAPAQPISAEGIRGDVFLAMLEQKPCDTYWFEPAAGPDGSKLSSGKGPYYSVISLDNYVYDPDFRGPNTIGCNGNSYAPITAGSHTYQFGHGYYGRFNGPPPSDYRRVVLSIPVDITDQDLTLGQTIKVDRAVEDRFEYHRDEGTFSIAYDAVMPFGTTLQWTEASPANPADPQRVRFFIHKGDNDREVRMCFNTHTDTAKQLQCVTWAVPADWQRGQMLTGTAQTMVHDQSVIPGQSGFAYWD